MLNPRFLKISQDISPLACLLSFLGQYLYRSPLTVNQLTYDGADTFQARYTLISGAMLGPYEGCLGNQTSWFHDSSTTSFP